MVLYYVCLFAYQFHHDRPPQSYVDIDRSRTVSYLYGALTVNLLGINLRVVNNFDIVLIYDSPLAGSLLQWTIKTIWA